MILSVPLCLYLSVNLVNSIEEFTEDGMDVTSGDGLIELRLDERTFPGRSASDAVS